MVVTVLEAHVPESRLDEVEPVFRNAMTDLPPEIVETFLTRSASDPTLFRLHTVWTSREALDAMRRSGVKPKGIQMFEAVGAHPDLAIFEVVVHRSHE